MEEEEKRRKKERETQRFGERQIPRDIKLNKQKETARQIC